MGLTSRLAAFAVNTSFSDIPGDVIEKSKEMMLNAAAVGLAGSKQKEGQIITEYVQQIGGEPQCTIMASGIRSSPVNAALAHGTMVHVLDYEEAILRRANHPSNVLFPVVLPLGEQMGLPGREVVTAFAVGCEVSTKLGAAGDLDVVQPTMGRYGWFTTSVAGAIGGAAAAGKLLGLNQEQMENALGVAVSQASGVSLVYGASTKSFQCGQAAMNGVMSAMLAQKGFTAARNVIEDSEGFLGCFRRDTNVDEDQFIHSLGNPYDVIDPGVALKLYPCGSATHTSIDAILYLIEQHNITPEQVQSVSVAIPPNMVMPFTQPETGLQGKFSITYGMVAALLHGQPRIHHFTDEEVNNSQVRDLLDRITVETTEQSTMEVSRPSTVTITLTDGRQLSHRVEHPRGHPTNPLSREELDAKFEYCSSEILSPERIQAAIDQFRRLEELPNVAPLAAILGG